MRWFVFIIISFLLISFSFSDSFSISFPVVIEKNLSNCNLSLSFDEVRKDVGPENDSVVFDGVLTNNGDFTVHNVVLFCRPNFSPFFYCYNGVSCEVSPNTIDSMAPGESKQISVIIHNLNGCVKGKYRFIISAISEEGCVAGSTLEVNVSVHGNVTPFHHVKANVDCIYPERGAHINFDNNNILLRWKGSCIGCLSPCNKKYDLIVKDNIVAKGISQEYFEQTFTKPGVVIWGVDLDCIGDNNRVLASDFAFCYFYLVNSTNSSACNISLLQPNDGSVFSAVPSNVPFGYKISGTSNQYHCELKVFDDNGKEVANFFDETPINYLIHHNKNFFSGNYFWFVNCSSEKDACFSDIRTFSVLEHFVDVSINTPKDGDSFGMFDGGVWVVVQYHVESSEKSVHCKLELTPARNSISSYKNKEDIDLGVITPPGDFSYPLYFSEQDCGKYYVRITCSNDSVGVSDWDSVNFDVYKNGPRKSIDVTITSPYGDPDFKIIPPNEKTIVQINYSLSLIGYSNASCSLTLIPGRDGQAKEEIDLGSKSSGDYTYPLTFNSSQEGTYIATITCKAGQDKDSDSTQFNIIYQTNPNDNTPPQIHLISPEDNHKQQDPTISLTYEAKDDYDDDLTCTLFIYENESGEQVGSERATLHGTKDKFVSHTYTTTLLDGTYKWHVCCVDNGDPHACSETRTFLIGKGGNDNNETKKQPDKNKTLSFNDTLRIDAPLVVDCNETIQLNVTHANDPRRKAVGILIKIKGPGGFYIERITDSEGHRITLQCQASSF
jgi:hypothetical protein